MADAQILRAARARIADPIHWTTGSYARNEVGVSIYPQDASAVCWCAYGALRADSTCWCLDENEALRQAAFTLYGTRSVAEVNDKHGHVAVLKMYDTAIAAADAMSVGVRLGLRLIGTVSDLPAGQKVRDDIVRDLRRIVDDALASVEAGL